MLFVRSLPNTFFINYRNKLSYKNEVFISEPFISK